MIYSMFFICFFVCQYLRALPCCVCNIRCGVRAPANCTSSPLRFIVTNHISIEIIYKQRERKKQQIINKIELIIQTVFKSTSRSFDGHKYNFTNE